MYSQEESLAFCSGQCQASRFPPASCRCICQGRNHGILRNRVFDVQAERPDYFPEYRVIDGQRIRYLESPKLLPDIQNRPVENRTVIPATAPTLTVRKGKYRIARKIGGSLKHALAGYSQDDLNKRIMDGLRTQFNQENTDMVIDQAFSIFYSHDPDRNRPELYELYENGDVDRALEMMNKRWVIGRPKR